MKGESKLATPRAIETLTLIKEARHQLKIWKSKEQILKDEAVEKYFSNIEKLVLRNGDPIARYYELPQSRVDQKRLAEEEPKIYKKYLIESSYFRLDIDL